MMLNDCEKVRRFIDLLKVVNWRVSGKAQAEYKI